MAHEETMKNLDDLIALQTREVEKPRKQALMAAKAALAVLVALEEAMRQLKEERP